MSDSTVRQDWCAVHGNVKVRRVSLFQGANGIEWWECPQCTAIAHPPYPSAPAPDAPAARERFPDAFAFRSRCCNGEKCLRCGVPADGKIEEVIFDDDPIQMRHPLTAYLCKAHLRETLIVSRVPVEGER